MKNNKDLLNDVQHALSSNTTLKNCLASIYVLVNNGSVIVAGAVGSLQLKQLAKTIVSAVPGVDLLIDDLKIEVAPQHRVGVQIDWAGGRMSLTE